MNTSALRCLEAASAMLPYMGICDRNKIRCECYSACEATGDEHD